MRRNAQLGEEAKSVKFHNLDLERLKISADLAHEIGRKIESMANISLEKRQPPLPKSPPMAMKNPRLGILRPEDIQIWNSQSSNTCPCRTNKDDKLGIIVDTILKLRYMDNSSKSVM